MRIFLLFTIFCLFSPKFCSAQVYVFGREDKADIVQNLNMEDGGSKILKQIAEKEGKWSSLLQTDAPGHGAVFCVSGQDGSNPQYFVSFGKSTAAQAIEEARSRAQEKVKPGLKVSIMRAFNNQNKYPLKRTE